MAASEHCRARTVDLVQFESDRGSRIRRIRCGGSQNAPQTGTKKANSAEDEDVSIVGNMRRVLKASHKPDAAALKIQLEAARRLLDLPFTQFEAKVAELAAGAGSSWLTVSLDLDDWADIPDPAGLEKRAEVFRLGLTLIRGRSDIPPPDFASGGSLAGFGLAPDKETIDRYPAFKDEDFASLEPAARNELSDYITKPTSPLHRSFAWLRATAKAANAVTPTPADPEQSKDPQRFSRLFGEVSAYLWAPSDATPTIERVLDMFYVPMAFRPLRPHPSLDDPALSLEFAQFLTKMLDDTVDGVETPGGIEVDAGTDAPASFAIVAKLRQELLPKVAARLADLLTPVHADQPPGGDPRFDFVTSSTQAALAGEAGAMLRSLLTETPSLFQSSKGIGYCWARPDSWSERLYALQIRKTIFTSGERLSLGRAADSAETGVDRDRFAFDKLFAAGGLNGFLDVLDDTRYDNEFEIAETRFQPPRPDWADEQGAIILPNHQIQLAGDIQARTGEDVIDQRNRFDEAGPARQLVADAIHWNSNWRTKDNRSFYLLPSRRFPATPLKVRTAPSFFWDGALWADLPAGHAAPNLNKQLKKRLVTILDKDRLEVPLSLGTDPVVAKPVAPNRMLAYLPKLDANHPPVAEGWWAIDTYIGEHFFLVEPDEENEFTNDVLRIECEFSDQTFADDPPKQEQEFKPGDELATWFQYLRLKLAQPDGALPTPQSVPLSTVAAQLEKWLAPVDSQQGLLVGAVTTKTIPAAAVVTEFTPAVRRLKEVTAPAGPGKLGTVLAAEIMQLEDAGGARSKFVLRLMMLDDRWSYSRVRVQVLRNARDVNEDDRPDINPLFRLTGSFSAWSSNQLEPAVLDFRSTLRSNLPPALTDLKPPLTLQDFKAATTHISYDPALTDCLAATFLDDQQVEWPLWNRAPSKDASLKISGLVIQQRFDLHPRYSDKDLGADREQSQLDNRTAEIPLQNLPLMPAADAAQMFSRIERDLVVSQFHGVRIHFMRAGKTVLTCIWPVKFDTGS